MPETTGTTNKYGITPGEGANSGGRKKLTMRMTEPDIPSPEELDANMKRLESKIKPYRGKKKKKISPPGANTELWPGGPGVDTNDIRLT